MIVLLITLGSLLWNSLFLLDSPLSMGDTNTYITLAEKLSNNAVSLKELPYEIVPGYPLFIHYISGGDYGQLGLWQVVIVQLLMSVITDICIFFIIYRLTGRHILGIAGLLISFTAVDRYLMFNFIMTETVFICFLLISSACYAEAIRKHSGFIFIVSIILFSITGLLRPVAAIFWVIAAIIWAIYELKIVIEQKKLNKKVKYKRQVVILIAVISIGGVVSQLGVKKEISTFDGMTSLLWIQTIDQKDRVFLKLFKKSPYFKDFHKSYKSWLSRKEMPKEMIKNGFWNIEKPWRHLREKKNAWTWYRIPKYVLMSEKGYSYAEVANWRGQVGLYLISREPLHFMNITLVKGVADILSKPYPNHRWDPIWSKANSMAESDFALSKIRGEWILLMTKNYENILKDFYLTVGPYSPIFFFIGIILACYGYRNPAFYLIACMCLVQLLIPAIFAGSLTRYRFPIVVYYGVIGIGIYLALEKLMIKYKSGKNLSSDVKANSQKL